MGEERKGLLPLLLLISFLLAFPLKMERSFQFFRLKKLEVKSCPSVRIERILIASLDDSVLRFWPLLFMEKKADLWQEVSSKEPLIVSKKIGWSKVQFNVRPLEMVLSFRWNDKRWYLSRDGYAWLDSHAINEELYGSPTEDFSIVIDPSMAPPVSGDGPVFTFQYDVSSFVGFIERIASQKWPGRVEAIRLFRQGGLELASIYIKKNNGDYFTVIVDNKRDLPGVSVAVADLLSSGAVSKSGAVMDASYEDKIIVRDF